VGGSSTASDGSFAALRSTGEVYRWDMARSSTSGPVATPAQTAVGVNLTNATKVSLQCAIRGTGEVWCSYSGFYTQVMLNATTPLNDAVDLGHNQCAIRASGQVWCWTVRNNSARLTPAPI